MISEIPDPQNDQLGVQFVTIWTKMKEIYTIMESYTPADIQTIFDEGEYTENVKKITDLSRTLFARIENIVFELERDEACDREGNPRRSKKLLGVKKPINDKIRGHLNVLRARMGFLKAGSAQTAAQPGPTSVAASGGAGFTIYTDQLGHQDQVLAKVKIRSKAVIDDASDLRDELEEIDVYMWTDASDLDVNRAMRKTKTWKDDLSKVVTAMRDVEEILTVANVRDQDVPAEVTEARESVEDLQKLFTDTKKEVEKEDIARGLHSLDISAAAKVSLPIFEGKDDEDWNVYKEKLMKALTSNKVKMADKCDKLRESLRGFARRFIPNSQNDFDTAIRDLEKVFSDSTRVVNAKISALNKLGPVPKNNDKKGGKAVVEWYINLETLLVSLLDLSKHTEDEDVKFAVYSLGIVKTVACLFPELYGVEILECQGTGETRLRNIIDIVSDLHRKAQQWLNSQLSQSQTIFFSKSCFTQLQTQLSSRASISAADSESAIKFKVRNEMLDGRDELDQDSGVEDDGKDEQEVNTLENDGIVSVFDPGTKLYYGSLDEDATELSVVMVDTEDEQNSKFSLCPVTSLAAAHNLNLTEELLWSTSSLSCQTNFMTLRSCSGLVGLSLR